MRTQSMITLLLSTVLLAGCQQQAAPVSFSADVKPILDEFCLPCHSGAMGEGAEASGFSVASYDEIMKGTRSGPVVDPGNRASSTLYRMVAHLTDPKIHMPPTGDQSLAQGRMQPMPERKIEVIGTWIDEGAQNN